eukprot:CAMPEP_0171147264 /NCGR_PEP_ID=MMETSP0766_2-20121228/147980_1 /TAXON_ID=439317 /ORGANISM="Gambierdiscus australes, Strain CAWD 149" /LENGTH=499 /DNA_ID=CAMNT_0011611173 /DNA_START=1 /DNA_END=1501 /DNA_ORIENTATION=-
MTSLVELEEQVALMEANYNESLDTLWMILASMLVFFMHAGFSLLEAGSVRFKNTQNILAKNLFVVTAGFLCWYVMGYPLALGSVKEPGKFAGGTDFFMMNFWEDRSKFRVWFFQGAFCATGGTIVSGAMAERTQLRGFGFFTVLMTSIIYPCVVYWTWSGNGFLSYTNEDEESVSIAGPAYMDFAGSGVVHMVGGVAALVGAATVGPRKDRYNASDEFGAHSVPFCALGTFFLWFGWYGFNPGSTGSLHDVSTAHTVGLVAVNTTRRVRGAQRAFLALGTFFLWFGWYGFNPGSTGSLHDVSTAHTVGLVAVNTTLSPCVSGLLVFFLRATICPPKLLDVGGFCNGILAGLVAITAGCSNVAPWESIIIGLIGGLIYQGASMLLQKVRIDDVVDAFPVHGACGCWGVIALGLFGDPDQGNSGNGAFYGGDQLGVQIVAVLLIALWSGILSALIFVPLKFLGLLRLSDDFQDKGADIMEHSPSKAYSPSKDLGQGDSITV